MNPATDIMQPATADNAHLQTRNQPARMAETNWYECDLSLKYWHRALMPDADEETTGEHQSLMKIIGEQTGSHSFQDAAHVANIKTPQLHYCDRFGNRIDNIEFDVSWQQVLGGIMDSGICGMPWRYTHGMLLRGVGAEMWARLDMGAMCPVSMTTAIVPVLQEQAGRNPGFEIDGVAIEQWLERCLTPGAKRILCGMAMTEPQGGSDLSDSSTIAVAADGSDEFHYHLTGHKWFCSHPAGDLFLMLGKIDDDAQLSCFAVPRVMHNGERNSWDIIRLKDKLGTKSLASGELQLRSAHGWLIGERGRGVRTIISMVNSTRMDCAVGSAGLMARAVNEVVAYTAQRMAFGEKLIDQPLMKCVVSDMIVEREAALALALFLCQQIDEETPVVRLLTAVSKYWITRRAVHVCIEAVETLGGNGYTEEFPLARLYRDAQVNSSWEGSGNVIVLDSLRTIAHDPEALSEFRSVVSRMCSAGDLGRKYEQQLLALVVPAGGVTDARTVIGRYARALQSALLLWRADQTSDAFDVAAAEVAVGTRCDGDHTHAVFGEDHSGLLAQHADTLIARYRSAVAA